MPLLQAATPGCGWRAPAPDLVVRACPQTIKDAIDCIRTLAVHVNSYGVVTSEEQARSIVKTHADLVSSAAVAMLTGQPSATAASLHFPMRLQREGSGARLKEGEQS